MSAVVYPLGIRPGSVIGAEVERLYRDGLPRGDSTGWEAMDKLYRVVPGQLTVITGIPGSGKSNWLDHLTLNLAKYSEWDFAIFSPENYPVSRHVAQLTAKHLAKPFSEGPTPRMSLEEALAATEWITDRYRFLQPQFSDPLTLLRTALDWRPSIRRPYGIVLDPWNTLEHLRPSRQSETEYVSETLTMALDLMREHGAHLWIVAHPAKLQRENGKRPIPTPYDIAGSAHWYNKADNCITVHRDQIDGGNKVEVHVQKVRFNANGRLGIADLLYDVATGCYSDVREVSASDYERARYGIDI